MRNAARRNESSRYTIKIGVTGGGTAGGGSGGLVPIEDLKGMDAVKAIDAMTSRGFAGVDESQADGGAKMKTEKNSDLFTVTIGSERFEIPEAVMAGG
ncbi:MAG: hypothetical protein R3D51_11680 [Hyphomicrobiaceae bacterium]